MSSRITKPAMPQSGHHGEPDDEGGFEPVGPLALVQHELERAEAHHHEERRPGQSTEVGLRTYGESKRNAPAMKKPRTPIGRLT